MAKAKKTKPARNPRLDAEINALKGRFDVLRQDELNNALAITRLNESSVQSGNNKYHNDLVRRVQQLEDKWPTSPIDGQRLARPAKQFCFVAVYDHQHGNDIRVFTTEAAASAWQVEIANEYWDDACNGKPKPATPAEIAEDYFIAAEDYEWFSVQRTELET